MLRGSGVILTAKRTQGVCRPRDGASKVWNAEPTLLNGRKATGVMLYWPGTTPPPGSKSGACRQGLPRNLGGLDHSLRRRAVRAPCEKRPRSIGAVSGRWKRTGHDAGYRRAKATKRAGKVIEQSEPADSTEEIGEPAPRDPREGSGRSEYGAFGGIDDEDIEPGNHLNTTTKASGTGPDRTEAGTDHGCPPVFVNIVVTFFMQPSL